MIETAIWQLARQYEATHRHCLFRFVGVEAGCIAHNVHVDCEDGARFVFLELWADAAAVKAHFAVPESGGFVKALIGLAAARPSMKIYQADEISAAVLG